MTSRALVIGAGLGGIAAAARLRARGYDVDVVDRLPGPGGRAQVHHRNGFVFDAGPTVLTAPFLIDELFGLFGRTTSDYVTLRPIDPWYRIRFHDGETFEYCADLDRMIDEIRRFEPADAPRYLRFLDKTREILRVGFEELGDQPFTSWRDMARVMPAMVKLQSFVSVYTRTARYIKNPRLRQVLSFHPLLVGGSPFTTTSIYSLIHALERKWGVHFAMGGTGSLVSGLVRMLEEEGVRFEYGRTVERIDVESGAARGVVLDGGELRRADVVVANADAPFVYKHLLPAEHRRKWTDRRVESMKYSMGLFVLYFGTTRTYPDLAHHEIHLGPRYEGLIKDIFEGDRLADDMSLYLHVPTRTDPSMAPAGCDAMYALVPVPNLRAPIDWETAGPLLRDRVVDQLAATHVPGLREHITEDFYVTPRHFRENLLSLHGAGFSVQPLLTQSASFRFHNRSEDVDNLFFVGAGTQPGAGVPGVMTSAKVMEKLLPDAVGVRPTRPSRRLVSAPGAVR